MHKTRIQMTQSKTVKYDEGVDGGGRWSVERVFGNWRNSVVTLVRLIYGKCLKNHNFQRLETPSPYLPYSLCLSLYERHLFNHKRKTRKSAKTSQ